MKKSSFKLLKLFAVLCLAVMAVIALAACQAPCTHANTKIYVISEATCQKKGDSQILCADCGQFIRNETIEMLPHDLKRVGEGKAPTCSADGYESYACQNCNYTEQQTVPKVDHSYEEGYCSYCGNNENGEKLLYNTVNTAGGVGCKIYGLPDTFTGTDIVIPSKYMGMPVVAIANEAFSQRDVRSVVIPASVTEIGNAAFYCCTNLKSVTFADGSELEKISSSAFSLCSSLKEIVLPASLVELDSRAFFECANLVSVSFEEGSQLKIIGGAAFEKCRNLVRIDIPEGVTAIRNGAFSNCSSLREVKIPSSITELGSAFSYCRSLVRVEIPATVTADTLISTAPFKYSIIWEFINHSDVDFTSGFATHGTTVVLETDSPKSVEKDGFVFLPTDSGVYLISSNLTDEGSVVLPADFNGQSYIIGKYAFYQHTSLVSVTLPQGVSKIEENAFYNCTKLGEVVMTHSPEISSGSGLSDVIVVANSTYGKEDKFSYLKENGVAVLVGCTGVEGDLVLPDTLAGGAYIIGPHAFDGLNITSITLSSNVAGIRDSAFEGIDVDYNYIDGGFYLGTADNPYFLLIKISGSIGSTFTMHDACQWVTPNTFCDAGWVAEIVLNSSVKGDLSFEDCIRLEKLTLSNGRTTILADAFVNCDELSEITFGTGLVAMLAPMPNGVTRINISSLESWLSIDFSYLSGGMQVYLNGSPISEVVIPESITEIKPYAFCGWTNLTKVVLHDGVTKIGEYALSAGSSLTEITVGTGLREFGRGVSSSVTRINIPSIEQWLATEVGFSQFYADFYINGVKVTEVRVPDGVTEIKPYAFTYWNTLTSIYLPDSVTRIGEEALSNSRINLIQGGRGVLVNESWIVPGSTTVETYVYGNVNYKLNEAVSPVSQSITWAYIKPGCEIAADFFNNCTLLTHVYVGSGATLGARAFYGTSSAIRVIFEDESYESETSDWRILYQSGSTKYLLGGVYSVSGVPTRFGTVLYGAYNEDGFAYTVQGGAATVVGYFGEDTELVIPAAVGSSVPVRYIGTSAFYMRDGITSLEIGKSVKSIGELAFFGLSSLQEVTLNVEEIGYGAFGDCAKLSSVTFENGEDEYLYIRHNAFQNCTLLTEITLPSSTYTVNVTAFIGCTNLNSIAVEGGHYEWYVVNTAGDITATLLLDAESFALEAKKTYDDTNSVFTNKYVLLQNPQGV